MNQRTRFDPIADGVYAVLGSNGMPNAVCIDGGADGVLVIDSRFTPQYAREMMAQIRAVNDGKVVALLNTHFHCDHVFGNTEVPTDRIIAHERAYAKLSELGDAYVDIIRSRRPDLRDELEGATVRLPTETISDELELRVGDLTLQIWHPGRPAHTDGDLLVHIPERKVLIAADVVFNDVVPVMRDGDVLGLRETLVELQDGDYDVVVPGHGELGGPDLIGGMIDFLDTVTDATQRTLDTGGSVEDAELAALQRTQHMLHAQERIGETVSQVVARGRG